MFTPPVSFQLGSHLNGDVLLCYSPQAFVVVQVLLDGSDWTLLADLAVLARSEETTLNHLLLQDVEDIPEGVAFIFRADRCQEVLYGLVIDVDVVLIGVTLADFVSLNSHLTLLLVGKDGGVHQLHLVDGSRNLGHNLGDDTTEFLEGIVDVADGEVGELSVGDDHTVGADEAVDTHHEAEGVETVVAVLDDDADFRFHIAVGTEDVGLDIVALHNYHMEGTDALGTLLGSALLGFDRIPAQFLHVFNDGLGIGVNVLTGNTGIGGDLRKSVRANGHDLLVGHRGHLVGQGNHCTHNSCCF